MVKGYTIYNGLVCQQHQNYLSVFDKLIDEIEPEQIIEIGTANGGFIFSLHEIALEKGIHTSIRTYDIGVCPNHALLDAVNIDQRTFNIFTDKWELNIYSIDDVGNFIKRDGKTLVICDGGNKPMEFNALAPLLKSGDHIIVHDYAQSYKSFVQDNLHKVWNWCECTYTDIEEAVEENQLMPFMYDEMKSIVWGSFYKSK